jgi:hypothetical protein
LAVVRMWQVVVRLFHGAVTGCPPIRGRCSVTRVLNVTHSARGGMA